MEGGEKRRTPPTVEGCSEEFKDLDHTDRSSQSFHHAGRSSEADSLKMDINAEIQTLIENLVSDVIITQDSCRKRAMNSVNSEDINTVVSENASCDLIPLADSCDRTKMSDQIFVRNLSHCDPDNGMYAALRKIQSSPSCITKLGGFSRYSFLSKGKIILPFISLLVPMRHLAFKH